MRIRWTDDRETDRDRDLTCVRSRLVSPLALGDRDRDRVCDINVHALLARVHMPMAMLKSSYAYFQRATGIS